MRDDLAFLNLSHNYHSYWTFQSFISSYPTFTFRPVSGILHGTCYWFLGTKPYLFHLINLTLFLSSVLVIYATLAKLRSPELAFLTSLFAIVYPCASSTLFVSIMMNSNLAGLLWAMALYIDVVSAKKSRAWSSVTSCVLLCLSSLSYEAFIPFFAVNIGVRWIVRRGSGTPYSFLRQSLPVLIAFIVFAVYRGLVEKYLFDVKIEMVKIPSLAILPFKWVFVIVLGIYKNLLGTFTLSLVTLGNLPLISMTMLVLFILYSLLLGIYICKKNGLVNYSNPPEKILNPYPKSILIYCAFALYCLAHLIYVFSDYNPNTFGWQNRSSGGIRFAASFLFACAPISVLVRWRHRQVMVLTRVAIMASMILFSLSIMSQREGWIEAAKYNDELIGRICHAIHKQGLDAKGKLVLVAELPEIFPRQVNGEPILGYCWEISQLISMRMPSLSISAAVYRPKETIILNDGIKILWWQAKYPFYFYKFSTDEILFISNSKELKAGLSP